MGGLNDPGNSALHPPATVSSSPCVANHIYIQSAWREKDAGQRLGGIREVPSLTVPETFALLRVIVFQTGQQLHCFRKPERQKKQKKPQVTADSPKVRI
ncbi:unnamed protein product [Caretta caretta]